MTDERDEEIARLKGELQAARTGSGGAVTGTLKVVGTLIALGVIGLIVLVVLGNTVAKPPTAEEEAAKLAAQINAKCDPKWTGSEEAAGECRLREFQIRGLPEG